MARYDQTIPDELVTHVTAICGSRGEKWFADLPDIIEEVELDWNIKVAEPFPGIEYNFVAEAYRNDGERIVVKIAPPFETVEIFGEAKYLRLHGGRGAIKLIAENRERMAILLERAVPGVALHQEFALDPFDCIDPAIRVLKQVLQPPPEDLTDVPTLDGWFGRFDKRFRTTVFPKKLAESALEIYERLAVESGRAYYIHGDFHPGNIVTAQREAFQVIDPKGIVGHLGYDIAVFLINLERWVRERSDIHSVLTFAIDRFAAAFGLSESEIRQWVFAVMVIGAWWNFEDMPNLYDPELAMPAIWHL
jgi:streptomycin 6-kinase